MASVVPTSGEDTSVSTEAVLRARREPFWMGRRFSTFSTGDPDSPDSPGQPHTPATEVVPEVTADSDYSLFHGYLMRADQRIAFLTNSDDLPNRLFHIADLIQQRMAPEWKARVGYVDELYLLSPTRVAEETDDTDWGRDPALVLALLHNRRLVTRCRWAAPSVTWLHKRYWRWHRTHEYDGKYSVDSDPHAVLCHYLASVPDAWLESASGPELRERLSLLVRTAREGGGSTTMLDEEDAKAPCSRQLEDQNAKLEGRADSEGCNSVSAAAQSGSVQGNSSTAPSSP